MSKGVRVNRVGHWGVAGGPRGRRPPVVLASDYLFDRCRAHEDRSAFAGSVSGACVEVCYVDRVSFPYFPSFSLIIVVLVGTCTSLTTGTRASRVGPGESVGLGLLSTIPLPATAHGTRH